MNLQNCDCLSFHQIAMEWSKERSDDHSFTKDHASSILYRAFWRGEFDHSNQTPNGGTCLNYPILSGGRCKYSPATREFVLRITPKNDPRWQPQGPDHPNWRGGPNSETMARLDAADYPDSYRHGTIGVILVPKKAVGHWLTDHGHPPMRFWFGGDSDIGTKTPDPQKTGFPGRPSSGKHLIEDEFARRVESGMACLKINNEAQELLAWYRCRYPEGACPTIGTIANNIREKHRKYHGSKPTK